MTDKLAPLKPGLRVYVDQSQHPVHDDVQSMGARLLLDNGDIAEVQIAHVADHLNIVVAGQLVITRDAAGRGFHHLQVIPTPKETK
jgi:hypothetical protein